MRPTAQRFTAIATALLAGVVSVPALALQFTFQVPYEFHKMGPDVKAARVLCAVYDTNGQALGSAYKTVEINRATGEASGTLNIAFDVDADKSAFDAVSYRCRMPLIWVLGANPPWQVPDATNANWQFRPANGEPLVTEVTGNVPGAIQKQAPRIRLDPKLRMQR